MGVFRPLPLLKVTDALPEPPLVRQFSKFGSPATAPHVLRGVQSSGYSPMRSHLSKSYTMSAAHISGAVCVSASKPCSHRGPLSFRLWKPSARHVLGCSCRSVISILDSARLGSFGAHGLQRCAFTLWVAVLWGFECGKTPTPNVQTLKELQVSSRSLARFHPAFPWGQHAKPCGLYGTLRSVCRP